MSMLISWHPLLPGENPGNTNLGGWRPLNPPPFKGRVRSVQIKAPDLLTGIRQLAQTITRRNLESAIQYVATMVSIRNRVTA